jgi:predicted O-methyltransferase YrrM
VSALDPALAGLFRFILQAQGSKRVHVLGPTEAIEALLESMPTLRRPSLEALPDEDSVPAGGGVVWLGPDERPVRLAAGKLYLADHAYAFEAAEHALTARMPTAWAAGAPTLHLAMIGPPSEAAAAAIAAVHAASHGQASTEPVPDAVGALLYLLARSLGARRSLDVGSSAGASLLWLTAAMSHVGGRVIGVERDSSRAGRAKKHISRAELGALAQLRVGELARQANKIAEPLSLVFLDEDLEDRLSDFEALMPMLSRGALIIAHGGRDAAAQASRYHAMIQLHPKVRAVQRVAIGEGLSLALLV